MKIWLTSILQSSTCSKVRIALFLGLVSSSVFSFVTTDQLQIQTSMPQYNFFRTPQKTRLTYNCAHLRSTKESLIIENLRRKLYWIFWVKIFRVKTFLVKFFLGENFWGQNSLGENFLCENLLGENFFGRKFFG